ESGGIFRADLACPCLNAYAHADRLNADDKGCRDADWAVCFWIGRPARAGCLYAAFGWTLATAVLRTSGPDRLCTGYLAASACLGAQDGVGLPEYLAGLRHLLRDLPLRLPAYPAVRDIAGHELAPPARRYRR